MDLPRPLASLLSDVTSDGDASSASHRAAIGLGSNLGDRFANIELALRLLESPRQLFDPTILGENPEVFITDTSFLYESAPMYMADQPPFINCACLIQTNIAPRALLSLLKRIETTVGRVPSVRNGPRAVDLDILLYDADVIDTRAEDDRCDLDNLEGHLVVPHPRMKEREFVLRPLNDMIPDFEHPECNMQIRDILEKVMSNHDDPPMHKVIPFPQYPLISESTYLIPGFKHPVPPTATYWTVSSSHRARHNTVGHKTYIMATLNATPDSFSDGSLHASIPAALTYVNSSITAGADIIDVGGYSTRPGAAFVSEAEETSRVLPVIQAVRKLQSAPGVAAEANKVLISVDTFRWEVAEAGILAGANCINDVYAFTGQQYPLNRASAEHLLAMRRVARDLAVPVVLMHSRGDPRLNKDYSDYADAQTASVLEGIRVELGEKVDAIVQGKNGIRRWFVIIDPGVGFSKTREDNLEILRNASLITKLSDKINPLGGYPLLIGPSKKSFLGTILAQADERGSYEGRTTEAKERGWATAAAVACAVQQEANVIRIHDVLEMGDVVRVASALWA